MSNIILTTGNMLYKYEYVYTFINVIMASSTVILFKGCKVYFQFLILSVSHATSFYQVHDGAIFAVQTSPDNKISCAFETPSVSCLIQ